MDKKELNTRKRNRILTDEVLDNMKKISEKIQTYSDNMDDDAFANSNEVEELYTELRQLGLDMWYVGK